MKKDSQKIWENIYDDITSYFKSKEYNDGEKKEISIQHQMILFYFHHKLFDDDYENKDNFFEINYIDIIDLIIEINEKEEKYEVCEILKKVSDSISLEIKK